MLPNGPVNHPTVRVFLAGGVPEVMLHLRALGQHAVAADDGGGMRDGDEAPALRGPALEERLAQLGLADGAEELALGPGLDREGKLDRGELAGQGLGLFDLGGHDLGALVLASIRRPVARYSA